MFNKLLKGLFGSADNAGSSEEASVPEIHDGFEIYAEPRASGSQWQVAGRIEMEVDGVRKTHTFIRADTMSSADEAKEHTIRKAKQLIAEQGASIFN